MGDRGQSKARVQGLDSIRFICALVVVLFHFGLISRSYFGTDPRGLAAVSRAILGCLFDGPAAVIVFFVISGFCIHFPFRQDPSVNIASYYSRRLIRIGAPALVALCLWNWVGVRLEPQDAGIFWSIICEVEYYLLYPVLLRLRLRFGWWPLILVGQLFAYGLALSHLQEIDKVVGGYPAFGLWNWVIGLPCWLIGCWLAEVFERFPQPSAALVWLSRTCVFGASVVLQALRFHGGSVYLSNAFTLNLFAMAVCFWLGLEIAYRREKPAPRVLEWAGKWSYSLYLMHPAVPGLLALQVWLRPALFSPRGNLLAILCSLMAAYGFYLLIEAPFHHLAIAVSRRLKWIRPPAVLTMPDS
jgi:peptidoglycan/LPS O-acetylase OafA/YrhL